MSNVKGVGYWLLSATSEGETEDAVVQVSSKILIVLMLGLLLLILMLI